MGDATGGFGVSKPAISKHLKVLEETGVVARVVDGRTHRLSLDTGALEEAAAWLDRQRAHWELAAERRRLPMVEVEKDYSFEGADGAASLIT